jgi:hypothetical protein
LESEAACAGGSGGCVRWYIHGLGIFGLVAVYEEFTVTLGWSERGLSCINEILRSNTSCVFSWVLMFFNYVRIYHTQ